MNNEDAFALDDCRRLLHLINIYGTRTFGL